VSRRRGRLLVGAALMLTLGGCTLLSFVYGRLDSIATAYADSWFDLERDQSKRFKHRARERLAINRREELPQYAAFLDGAARLVEGRPSAAELDALIERGRELFELGLRRSLPLMTETLAELAPRQVEYFTRELDERNAEYRDEELDVDPEERQEQRREELQHEVERWTGRLVASQRAILDRLVAQVPDGARAWYEHRLARQRGLLELLRARASAAEHARYIERWWLGDRHLEPDHAAQLARNRQSTVSTLAELIATLTPKQRARVAARLRAIGSELEELHAAGREAAGGG